MANVGMALSEATKKRLKAGRMLLVGKSCAEVALAVGVARQTVYTWKRHSQCEDTQACGRCHRAHARRTFWPDVGLAHLGLIGL